jgi:sigma-B regulation protein RsbU (phosphoserine phosphatase)
MQERTFPTAHPAIRGLDYFGDWRPARNVSGDYIDYFEMNDGNLGLVVGDVRSRGITAARLKASLRGMIRALRVARNSSLKTMVRTIDRLFGQISPDHSYATLFVGEYNPSNGRLRYVNAGHEPPFVLRRSGGHFQTMFLEPGGPVIGMLREPSYREGVLPLHPGDVLVAYTDGLCETTNNAGEEWGWPRFLEAVEEAADQRACDMVEEVMQRAAAFSGGAPPSDDATLFVGRVQEAAAETPRWEVERVAATAAA